jgi:hypothetical protein
VPLHLILIIHLKHQTVIMILNIYDSNGKDYILRNVDMCTGTSISLVLPTEELKKDKRMKK